MFRKTVRFSFLFKSKWLQHYLFAYLMHILLKSILKYLLGLFNLWPLRRVTEVTNIPITNINQYKYKIAFVFNISLFIYNLFLTSLPCCLSNFPTLQLNFNFYYFVYLILGSLKWFWQLLKKIPNVIWGCVYFPKLRLTE